MYLSDTVTVQVAVFPLCVLAVMVAEPIAAAVILPALSTVATEVLDELQVTSWLVALAGATVAAS